MLLLIKRGFSFEQRHNLILQVPRETLGYPAVQVKGMEPKAQWEKCSQLPWAMVLQSRLVGWVLDTFNCTPWSTLLTIKVFFLLRKKKKALNCIPNRQHPFWKNNSGKLHLQILRNRFWWHFLSILPLSILHC